MRKLAVFIFLMSVAVNALGSEKERISCLEGVPQDYLARLSIEETTDGRLKGLGGFNGALDSRFICDDDVEAGRIFCTGLLDKRTGEVDRFVTVEILRENMKAVMKNSGHQAELICSTSIR